MKFDNDWKSLFMEGGPSCFLFSPVGSFSAFVKYKANNSATKFNSEVLQKSLFRMVLSSADVALVQFALKVRRYYDNRSFSYLTTFAPIDAVNQGNWSLPIQ